MKKGLNVCIGIVFSVACLSILFYHTDIAALQTLLQDLQYAYLIPFAVSVVLAQLVIGCRYFFFLGKTISLRKAVIISILGTSANLVLPVRGGELLKAYLTQQASSLGYVNILSRIVLERGIDLGFAFILGLIAVWELGNQIRDPLIYKNLLYLALFSFLCVPTVFLLIKIRVNSLIHILKKIASFFKKEAFIEGRFAQELHSLSSFLSFKNLRLPLLLSLMIWYLLHTVSYWATAQMLSISFNHSTVLFMLFAGAIGFLLPSAPSGLGVVHASLSSAMVLLGHPLEKGIAFALIYHLCVFISLALLGCCAWFCFVFLRADLTYPGLARKSRL